MSTLRSMTSRAAVLLPLSLAAAPVAAQFPVEREIRVTPGQTLDVELDAGGSVRVVGSDRGTVRLRVEEGSRPCRPECRVEIDSGANGVRVHAFHDGTGRNRSSSLRLVAEVPRRFNLKIHSTGGAVDVENVTGKITGRTMGGALKMSRLGGELDFTTMGGGVTVRDSEVEGKVHTMGGEVLLENVGGGLRGSTMGGKVTRRGAGAAAATGSGSGSGSGTGSGGGSGSANGTRGEVHMRSMGGGIKVESAPQGADVQTMGGDIRVRSAASHVRARTMGGEIELGAVDGSVRATTMGGDVRVRMVGDPGRGDRSVEITSMGGDIELVVPAGLSMNVDIELAYTENHEGDYRVTSDFPLQQTVSPEWDRRRGSPRKTIRATGSVAGGRHPVRIRTVNGNVRLVRGQ